MTAYKRRTDTGRKGWSFGFHIKNGYQLILLFGVFLLAAGIMWAASAMGSNVINNEKNTIFQNRWQYSINDGAFSEVTLPNSKKNVLPESCIILKNHLPVKTVKGTTILLRTSQQDVEVYVNDEMIYSSFNRETNTPSPSSAYHFVRLPNDCGGKSITVVLSSPFKNYAGFMSQIYIGSKASNLFFLFQENGFRFIIGFLVFSVGFLLMLMFLFAKWQENTASVTNLGAFFVCAGYWVMVESTMMQFFIPYPMALTNSSIFALSLLPVFSGLYYYNTHTKVFRRVGKCVLVVVTIASLLFAVAACVKPMLPIRVLPFYLVFLVIYLILLFVSIFIESIKAGKIFSASVCGMLAFGVCAMLELIFYLCNIKSYNRSNFLTMGLLLISIFMVVDSIQNFTRVYNAAIKVDTLSVLAYNDSLTGLKNRTAFLEAMSVIEEEGENTITIAMYDINNLKLVNDTMGHLVGDALLRHSAKVIKTSLRQEDTIYRIGGDEFVAIIRHGANFDYGCLEARLLSVLQKENQKNLSYTLSIAYGFATFSKSIDKTLFATQARADKKMYACKKIQKASETHKQNDIVKDAKE